MTETSSTLGGGEVKNLTAAPGSSPVNRDALVWDEADDGEMACGCCVCNVCKALGTEHCECPDDKVYCGGGRWKDEHPCVYCVKAGETCGKCISVMEDAKDHAEHPEWFCEGCKGEFGEDCPFPKNEGDKICLDCWWIDYNNRLVRDAE